MSSIDVKNITTPNTFDLTINTVGSGTDVIFKSNGTQTASISDGGVITATSFAGSGANLTGLSSFDPDGAVVFNESSADVDFRVESNNATHALFVNGANGNVGINTSSATSPLTVNGEMHTTDNLGVGQAPAAWRSVDTAIDFGDCSAVFSHTSNYTYLAHNWYDDGTDKYKTTDEAAAIELSHNGDIHFKQAASGSADAAISWSTNLSIMPDGRGLSQFTAKVWCKVNTTSSSIDDSHNVSSISDHGTGDFTISFTNANANDKGVAIAHAMDGNHNSSLVIAHINSNDFTGSCRVLVTNSGTSAAIDGHHIHFLAFGD